MKFEAGRTYRASHISRVGFGCGEYSVTARTEKTVTIRNEVNGQTERRKLYSNEYGEYFYPESGCKEVICQATAKQTTREEYEEAIRAAHEEKAKEEKKMTKEQAVEEIRKLTKGEEIRKVLEDCTKSVIREIHAEIVGTEFSLKYCQKRYLAEITAGHIARKFKQNAFLSMFPAQQVEELVRTDPKEIGKTLYLCETEYELYDIARELGLIPETYDTYVDVMRAIVGKVLDIRESRKAGSEPQPEQKTITQTVETVQTVETPEEQLKARVKGAYSKTVRRGDFTTANLILRFLRNGVIHFGCNPESVEAESILEDCGCVMEYSRSYNRVKVYLKLSRRYDALTKRIGDDFIEKFAPKIKEVERLKEVYKQAPDEFVSDCTYAYIDAKCELARDIFSWVVARPDFHDPDPDNTETTPPTLKAASEYLDTLIKSLPYQNQKELLEIVDMWVQGLDYGDEVKAS